nr:hypothetical protein [Propionibacterium sp.]
MTGLSLDADQLEHFACRVLADVLSEATADYWQARAQRFLDARHRPGIDFAGRASQADLESRARRLEATAAACRARASLEGPGLPVPPIVAAELLRGVV